MTKDTGLSDPSAADAGTAAERIAAAMAQGRFGMTGPLFSRNLHP
ncbi:hypothetical protein [Leisingera aquimarina]|nr:hypothetical protein [Leisingera aquimarina]